MFASVTGFCAIRPFRNKNLPSGSVMESCNVHFTCVDIRIEVPLVFANGLVAW